MITAGEVLARSGEGLKSGPLGLAVILVLCVASYFLFKSMSKHLKKVREEFPSETPSTPLTPQAAARQAAARELAAPQPTAETTSHDDANPTPS